MSATNARKGSIEMLIDASRIHSSVAAIQRPRESGMKKSAIDARMAPVRKYGRRRPSGPQVRSLSAPTMGCTNSPVSGAASQRIGT